MLEQLKQQMEAVKTRLDSITVEGKSPDGNVTATVTGNRKVVNIDINGSLATAGDKEQLEDMVTIAVNDAMQQADKVNESEMQSAAAGMLPGLGGLLGG